MDDSPPGACRAEPGVCNATLQHLQAHCDWRRIAFEVRAVHFKGSAKPWRVFSCFGLREGRLKLSPNNVTLGPNDVLSWDSEKRACVSRMYRGSGSGGAGDLQTQAVTYGTSGGPLPRQCCRTARGNLSSASVSRRMLA